MARKKTQLGFEMKDETIYLPTDADSFNALIDELVMKWQLPNREHAAAVVAKRIMHLPVDQATTTHRYLAHCVVKDLAYQTARFCGQTIAHNSQIDALVSALTTDPLDQQSRDQLETAYLDGQGAAKDYCKEALIKLNFDLPQAKKKKAEDTGDKSPDATH